MNQNKRYNSIFHFLEQNSQQPNWEQVDLEQKSLFEEKKSEEEEIVDLIEDDDDNKGFRIFAQEQFINLNDQIDQDIFLSADKYASYKSIKKLSANQRDKLFSETGKFQKFVNENKESTNFKKNVSVGVERLLSITNFELISFIWFSVTQTNLFKSLLKEKGLSINDDDYNTQLSKHPVNESYSLLLYHTTLKSMDKIEMSLKEKKMLIDEIFSEHKSSLFSQVQKDSYQSRSFLLDSEYIIKNKRFSQKAHSIIKLLNRSKAMDLYLNLDYEIFLLPYPDLIKTSFHSKKSTGVGINQNPSTSSVGVITTNRSGRYGATLCYHDFMNISGFGLGSTVYIDGKEAVIESIHKISDSCFATFKKQNLNIQSYKYNNGPLRNVGPGINLPVHFSGLTSGSQSTIIQAIDPSIPFIKPSSGIINQQKVYTPPSSQPGDSGAALIDAQDNVIGFATYRTGFGAIVPFSVWVWAEEVYYHNNL